MVIKIISTKIIYIKSEKVKKWTSNPLVENYKTYSKIDCKPYSINLNREYVVAA